MKSYLSLSSKGLRHVPSELYYNKFEFVIGGVNYECSTLVAEFLSPKICALRRADPTVCKFELETPDPSHKFGCFLSLPFESNLGICREDIAFFGAVSWELENEELACLC